MQLFQTNCSSRNPLDQIKLVMRKHYNSETRNLQLQSEVDSIELSSFMRKHNFSEISIGLSRFVDRINALAPKLQKDLETTIIRLGICDEQ